jgi:hypothetical protein
MADKQKPADWRDGPYGPAAQDRMDDYERARLAGELPPVRAKPLAADDPRFAENKGKKP